MKKLQVHNKRLNAWFVVDNGKVYDAKTMIQCPDDARETSVNVKIGGKCLL
jgi:hypothetical protein